MLAVFLRGCVEVCLAWLLDVVDGDPNAQLQALGVEVRRGQDGFPNNKGHVKVKYRFFVFSFLVFYN